VAELGLALPPEQVANRLSSPLRCGPGRRYQIPAWLPFGRVDRDWKKSQSFNLQKRRRTIGDVKNPLHDFTRSSPRFIRKLWHCLSGGTLRTASSN
jgi:hypothetical protein